MYDHVVDCQRAGLCLSEHFLISYVIYPNFPGGNTPGPPVSGEGDPLPYLPQQSGASIPQARTQRLPYLLVLPMLGAHDRPMPRQCSGRNAATPAHSVKLLHV